MCLQQHGSALVKAASFVRTASSHRDHVQPQQRSRARVQTQSKGKFSFPSSLGCREPAGGLASQMKGHDLRVLFLSLSLSTGTLRERTQTLGLILYFLPSRSHSPACQHTSLSLSLTCKQRANCLANTVALGFWSSNEDLMETLPCFRAPGAARMARYHPHVNIGLCVPNWRGLAPNCL